VLASAFAGVAMTSQLPSHVTAAHVLGALSNSPFARPSCRQRST
jgi:hypothetical protein